LSFPRKRESRKISMEIYETIKQWYEDTLKEIEAKIGPDVLNADEIDKLCLCVVKTSYQYCSAVFQLLDKGYEFPARALMRSLGELNAKFTWCLVGNNNTSNNPEAIKERVQRWRKSACDEGIKLLEKSESVMCPEDKEIHEKIMSDLKQHLKELDVEKGMPQVTQIFEQLSKSYDVYNKIRPAFYSVFNNAVHLDPASMSTIYVSQQQGQDSTQSYFAASAYNINFLTRSRYGLNTKQVQDEFIKIMDL